MTHAHRTDPDALAATLRQWALRLLAALLELFDGGPFARLLRRWSATQLTRAERGAMALVLLAAVRNAGYMPPPRPCAARPLAGPRGFHCRPTRETRVVQMTRGLFPKGPDRERNLVARARRLAATLADLDAAAQPVVRRLRRAPLLWVLVPVSPPSARLAQRCADVTAPAHDTS